MRILLLAIGTRVPEWVSHGFHEYAKRLPRSCRLELVELPLARRRKKSHPEQYRAEEGERLLAALPKHAQVIALDVGGAAWSTAELSRRLATWLGSGQDVALLVGGPDGLDHRCLERATQRWSLSPLTLPHALVRVVVSEQLYRAWSLLNGHPYHRE